MDDVETLTDALLKLILVRSVSAANQELVRERALELVQQRTKAFVVAQHRNSNSGNVGNLGGQLLPPREYRLFLEQFNGMSKIEAIKALRSHIRCGLLEAKQFIEAACTFTIPSNNQDVPKVTGKSTLHIRFPEAY